MKKSDLKKIIKECIQETMKKDNLCYSCGSPRADGGWCSNDKCEYSDPDAKGKSRSQKPKYQGDFDDHEDPSSRFDNRYNRTYDRYKGAGGGDFMEEENGSKPMEIDIDNPKLPKGWEIQDGLSVVFDEKGNARAWSTSRNHTLWLLYTKVLKK